MPVYLPTAVVGNQRTLITLGHGAELMSWFYPSKDDAQNIYQCMPCVYLGSPGQGLLHWTWGDEWCSHQEYIGNSNVLRTVQRAESLGIELEFDDLMPDETALLLRQVTVRSLSPGQLAGSLFHFGDWNLGGVRTGNALSYDPARQALVQSRRDIAVAIGGTALQSWQCGKAGVDWGSNAMYALQRGALQCQDLEIGDVNWAFGFSFDLPPGQDLQRTAIFALGRGAAAALELFAGARDLEFRLESARVQESDSAWLVPGLQALERASSGSPAPGLPDEILQVYRRSLLCLPLLCGEEGAALAAPEFDPEFISCGGYGYLWPRDGAEYVSGLMDAGYPRFSGLFFDWCARHQNPSGLWHQRYFLNGEPGPNWCLPPDHLQIDQVGAVLWAYGKYSDLFVTGDLARPAGSEKMNSMVKQAADYLVSRLTERGVHSNAFDTWESFVGSFTYSNAAVYAAFKTAERVLDDPAYREAACRVKEGVLTHFVQDNALTRGFNASGERDLTIDSSSLGAIEPFGLLDLSIDRDLCIAEGTLRKVREKLEVDWEGGRAIRRFEGDSYVGGVPACVNTLWMARCCLHVAGQLEHLGRRHDAAELTDLAQLYLVTVLRRTTPTGLLPELMQGPTGQRYWAAPHGWAMASFVSAVLKLANMRSALRTG